MAAANGSHFDGPACVVNLPGPGARFDPGHPKCWINESFEEDQKGTLSVGRRADLVILDRDPLTVDPSDLQSITVIEAIKDGRTVFIAS